MLLSGVKLDGTHPSPIDHHFGRVTAIVGPSGSGKSRLLLLLQRAREIAAAYGGPRQGIAPFARQGAPGVRVILDVAFDEQERTRFGVGAAEEVEVAQACGGEPRIDVSPGARAVLEHYDQDGAQGFWELVPADRITTPAFVDLVPAVQRRLRAVETATKYSWLETFFADVALGATLVGGDVPGIVAVNEAFERVKCPLRLDHARRRGATYTPCFDLFGETIEGMRRLPAGIRQAVLFVGLVSLLNPRRSVLLVDDLERDLDPELQIGVLGLLAEGGNQVLFSTRSEKLASSALVTSVLPLSRPTGAEAVPS